MPRPDRRPLILLPLIAAASLVRVFAYGAEPAPEQKLRAVEQQLDRGRSTQEEYTKQAEALELELTTLRASSVAAAETAQRHETALSNLEAQRASLASQEAQKRLLLGRGREHERQLLIALERLALNPPEALTFGPSSPADTIRGGILIGAAVPRLESEARALHMELAELQRLRATIHDKEQKIATERRGLEREQARLQTLIVRKSALRERALQGVEQTGQLVARLSIEAGDLHELIERLEAERKAREEATRRETERQARAAAAAPRAEAPPGATHLEEVAAPAPVRIDPTKPKTIRPFAKARGAMVFPVSGILIRRYGETNEFGVANKGLTLDTRPGAVVVAPFDGRIEFAGPFKGYGQILIIQHGDGYHSLLAGLERIDGAAGDWLVAGEPVGAMTSSEPTPRLYLELRHDGQPINPLPWLATHDEKVSG